MYFRKFLFKKQQLKKDNYFELFYMTVASVVAFSIDCWNFKQS